MTVHLSKGLLAAAFLSITIVLLAGGCDHSRSTPEGATVASEVSRELIGKQITIRGRFSLRGKITEAYTLLDNHKAVYLQPRRSFTWRPPYSEMEGKLVEATDTLRFYHDPDEPANRANALPVARPPDYFYFEVETTQLRPI